MMLTPEIVNEALDLFFGNTAAGEDREALAEILESREELLAHLIVVRDVFEDFPALARSLHDAAARETVLPGTPRHERGLAHQVSAKRMAVEAELRQFLDLEAASLTELGKLHIAIRQLIDVSPVRDSGLDLAWSVVPRQTRE